MRNTGNIRVYPDYYLDAHAARKKRLFYSHSLLVSIIIVYNATSNTFRSTACFTKFLFGFIHNPLLCIFLHYSLTLDTPCRIPSRFLSSGHRLKTRLHTFYEGVMQAIRALSPMGENVLCILRASLRSQHFFRRLQRRRKKEAHRWQWMPEV